MEPNLVRILSKFHEHHQYICVYRLDKLIHFLISLSFSPPLASLSTRVLKTGEENCSLTITLLTWSHEAFLMSITSPASTKLLDISCLKGKTSPIMSNHFSLTCLINFCSWRSTHTTGDQS